MTNSIALLELFALIEKYNDFSYTGKRNLLISVEKWSEKWINTAQSEILVTNSKYLTSEYEDYLKYKLCEIISENIAEECAEFNLKNNKISATLLCMRRRAKE